MALGDLHQPEEQHQLRRRSLSQSNLIDPDHAEKHESFAAKRSVSYYGSMGSKSDFRVRIRYQDEALRLRAQTNFKQLLQSALNETTEASQLSNNNNSIAKKALKYRKVLDRMSGVDINDPQFDVSEFLGVHWCKTIILADTPCTGT